MQKDTEEQEECLGSQALFDSLCYGENDPFMPEPLMPEGLSPVSMEGQYPKQMLATELELWLHNHPSTPPAIASNPVSTEST
jgi:hypothetical protein